MTECEHDWHWGWDNKRHWRTCMKCWREETVPITAPDRIRELEAALKALVDWAIQRFSPDAWFECAICGKTLEGECGSKDYYSHGHEAGCPVEKAWALLEGKP